jgi:hypothetical protein
MQVSVGVPHVLNRETQLHVLCEKVLGARAQDTSSERDPRWMRPKLIVPKLIVKEHTNLTDQDIDGIPDGKTAVRSDNRSRDSRQDVSQLAQIDPSGSGGQR